ncbi:MAG: ATP-binding protein [Bacteroidales bacterium]|jgi:predicted AAA+ superfamily ATPase|nr:ATP-binding protein [Bacteroidales bacterium]MCI1785637.1 ATP-binding protein [Bacteroidales bacterium]
MIGRKIDQYFEDFYKTEKKALLVTGARQIGKTFSIRNFGKTHYSSFLEINFIDSPEAIGIFSNAKNSSDILLRMSAYTRKPLIKGKTLIFFDEVQECNAIITAIKFLVDEGSYSYIMSGSLLGVELNDIRSVPVGYMDIKEMYPLDFEEFTEAIGLRSTIISGIRNSWKALNPVDDFIHKKLMELFRLYLIVGGMPAVVQKYLDTNNLRDVMNEQQAIIKLYKKDISKYDKNHKLYIEEIFNLIPPELNAKNKRFILKRLNENVKFSRYEDSFIWLKDAGVALPVYNVEEPVIPLVLSRSRNLFKLFQNDVGLLAGQYADDIQLNILNNEKSINFGSVYENAVAQELHAHGFDLYYFNSKKQGELDFVIEQNGHVIPIEVKSGKDYERHNALTGVMNDSEYGIQKAFVLCNGNLKVQGNIVYLPIYMVMFLTKKSSGMISYKVDLNGLQ